MQHLQKTQGGGAVMVNYTFVGFLLFTTDWRPTNAHRRFAAAPTARKRPSHPARASSAQTPARRAPPESAGILQPAPAMTPDREVLPDSTGSNSLSRSSAAPATAPRAVHLQPNRSSRQASRIQTSDAPTFAADIPCRNSSARKADISC